METAWDAARRQRAITQARLLTVDAKLVSSRSQRMRQEVRATRERSMRIRTRRPEPEPPRP